MSQPKAWCRAYGRSDADCPLIRQHRARVVVLVDRAKMTNDLWVLQIIILSWCESRWRPPSDEPIKWSTMLRFLGTVGPVTRRLLVELIIFVSLQKESLLSARILSSRCSAFLSLTFRFSSKIKRKSPTEGRILFDNYKILKSAARMMRSTRNVMYDETLDDCDDCVEIPVIFVSAWIARADRSQTAEVDEWRANWM